MRLPLRNLLLGFWRPVLAAFLITSLDQISKRAVLALTARGDLPTQVTFFLNIICIKNTGISFGLLKAGSALGTWLLIVGAGAIIIGLCVWYVQAETCLLRAGLVCIIAGAVSNMIDRLMYHGVIDFIDFHWAHDHFPTFNIADTMISLGTMLILWDAFRTKT